jgi:hemerythrin superfamily protein
MDAIELLTSDHDEVRALFEQFRSAHEGEDEETMVDIAQQVMLALEAHTTIEEEIFYPAVREADPELAEDVAEAGQEHHVVDVLMNEMREEEPSSEVWVAKMQVLMENVEHHAEEEENEMFSDVREAMDDARLDELGQQLQERKQQLLGESTGDGEVDIAAGDAGVDLAAGDAEVDLVAGDAEVDAEAGDAEVDDAVADADIETDDDSGNGGKGGGRGGRGGDDLGDMSKDELYAKAKELDISGRSNMNKDQLVKAIEKAQG